jgi:phospholipid-transporting ATPase
VITGAALRWALTRHPGHLLRLARACHSVVCCRVTPLQKAEVVRLVRDGEGAICLAIGDGANDVAMIQAAHVGVGIFGQEGSQAARSADYAIRMFRHLRRLLSVHGRYALVRNSLLVQYSFYKSAAVFMSVLWFAFYSGFSAWSLYDSWQEVVYNILVTSSLPFIIGLFERDVPESLIQFVRSLCGGWR